MKSVLNYLGLYVKSLSWLRRKDVEMNPSYTVKENPDRSAAFAEIRIMRDSLDRSMTSNRSDSTHTNVMSSPSYVKRAVQFPMESRKHRC